MIEISPIILIFHLKICYSNLIFILILWFYHLVISLFLSFALSFALIFNLVSVFNDYFAHFIIILFRIFINYTFLLFVFHLPSNLKHALNSNFYLLNFDYLIMHFLLFYVNFQFTFNSISTFILVTNWSILQARFI